MTNELSLNQVTVGVTDVAVSFHFYRQLGLLPIVRSLHYARFIAPGNESTFSIHLTETVSSTTTVYFEVGDIDRLVEHLADQGFRFEQLPADQPWEWREARLLDPDGNEICLYHAGTVRMDPDWRLPESRDRHVLSRDRFDEWMESYRTAWESQSAEWAVSLFSDDVSYYETPFVRPITGKEPLHQYWQLLTNLKKEISLSYEIIHTYQDTGFCKWNIQYTRIPSGEMVAMDGIFEVTFNNSGKCCRFRAWWHQRETSSFR